MEGAVLCTGTLCTVWNVQQPEDITLDSIALLDLITPAPGDDLSLYMAVMMTENGSLFFKSVFLSAFSLEQAFAPFLDRSLLKAFMPVGAHLSLHGQAPACALTEQVSAVHADLLIIGCGRASMRLPKAFTDGLSSKGISVEAIDTPNAAATFNILNQEGRKVAGALLPLGN